MSEEPSSGEVPQTSVTGDMVALQIPDAQVSEEVLLPVYSNLVTLNTSTNEVVMTFFHASPLQMRPEGETTVYNRIVHRVVLPRPVAKKLGEILQKNLGE